MGVQGECFQLCWALKGTHLCEQPGGHAESKISISLSETADSLVGRGLMVLFSLDLIALPSLGPIRAG